MSKDRELIDKLIECDYDCDSDQYPVNSCKECPLAPAAEECTRDGCERLAQLWLKGYEAGLQG